jgi:hypothetical protein
MLLQAVRPRKLGTTSVQLTMRSLRLISRPALDAACKYQKAVDVTNFLEDVLLFISFYGLDIYDANCAPLVFIRLVNLQCAMS